MSPEPIEIEHEYREGEAQFASATGHNDDDGETTEAESSDQGPAPTQEFTPVDNGSTNVNDDFPGYSDRPRPDNWDSLSDSEKFAYVTHQDTNANGGTSE